MVNTTKLFEPIVLGAGVTIENTPTLPKHAVRKIDLEGHITAQKFVLTEALTVSIPKQSDDFFIQCYNELKQKFEPDSATETETSIEINFLNAQTGIIRVLFIGGSGGD